jgi:hypothetical protein
MSADPQTLIAALADAIGALNHEAKCVQRAAMLVMQRTAADKHDAIGLVYFLHRATLHLDSVAWQDIARAMCGTLRIDWASVLKASDQIEPSPPQ